MGAAYALTGCGATASQQVDAKLQQFAHAIAARDSRTLCERVFSASLAVRFRVESGSTCVLAMRLALSGVVNGTVSVSRIAVHGSTASAVLLTGARGQPAALSRVTLTHTSGGWRVASTSTL